MDALKPLNLSQMLLLVNINKTYFEINLDLKGHVTDCAVARDYCTIALHGKKHEMML